MLSSAVPLGRPAPPPARPPQRATVPLLAALALVALLAPLLGPALAAVARAAAWALDPASGFDWGSRGAPGSWLGMPPRVLAMVGRGLLLGFAAGLVATAIGATVCAVWLAPASARRLGLTLALLAALLGTGSVVQLMAWRVAFDGVFGGAGGWVLAAVSLGMRYAPIAAAVIACGLAAMARSEFESALVLGGPAVVWRIARRRLARLAAAAVVAVAALGFAESELPALLGIGVFAEEFLSQVALQPSTDAAVAHGWPLMAMALLAGLALARVPRLQRSLDGRWQTGWIGAWPAAPALLRRGGWLLALLLATPLATLAAGAWLATGRWPAQAGPALAASLAVAAAAAALAVAWGALLIAAATRLGGAGEPALQTIALAMMLWPSALTALGVSAWNLPAWLGGAAPLVAAHAVHALPFVLWLLLALNDAAAAGGRQQARLLGGPWWPRWRRVLWPADAPRLAAAFALAAALSLAELTATVLTVPAGTETVILRIYNLMHYGDQRGVLTLATLQAAVAALAAVAAVAGLRRRGGGAGA